MIVAQCLQAFSIGLVFNGWMLILNRSFYAVQTNWVPTGIAVGAVALNAAFDTVFYRSIWGIRWRRRPSAVAATVLLVMMRRRVGLEHRSHPRVVGASPSPLPCCRASYGRGAGPTGARHRALRQLLALGAGFAAAGLVYVALARRWAARARGVATVASPARRALRPR